MIVIVWQYTFVKTEKEHETKSHILKYSFDLLYEILSLVI